MKCILFLSLFLFACGNKQEAPKAEVTPKPEAASIDFSLNGRSVHFTSVQAMKTDAAINGFHSYSFFAAHPGTPLRYFNMIVAADTLMPGQYEFRGRGLVSFIEGENVYTNFGNGFSLNVTKKLTGHITASFRGTLYRADSTAVYFAGSLNDVQILKKPILF